MQRATLVISFLMLVTTATVTLADTPRNTLVPAGDNRYAPTGFPDRVVLGVTQNPARSQTVNWRTSRAVTDAVAQITVARATPGLHPGARTVSGTVRRRTTENGLAHHHTVTFDGLRPDTLYAYRVRGRDTWSEWFQFRTAKEDFSPFSFLYFGDAQNSVRSHFSRVIREAFAELSRPALTLHAGDLVNLREGVHDDEWGEWFDAGAFLNAMTRVFPVAGNHEHVYAHDEAGNRRYVLSDLWDAQFGLPDNGPPELSRTVYHMDFQGVLFVSLDSTRALEDERLAIMQAEWLEALLQDHDYRWVIVSHHHPLYSVTIGRDNPELRQHWQPVYARYGVDLVLQGHDHAYGRGANAADGTTVVDGEVGTVYVVSVAGPKMYLASDSARETLTRTGEDVQLFQVIHVEAGRLVYESRTVTGELYDAFDIHRLDDGSRRFIDRASSALPESRCGNPVLPRPTRCWEGTELVD